ncbi:MAG: hypothetical protein ACO1G9_01575 [Bacteroidota bacterium]
MKLNKILLFLFLMLAATTIRAQDVFFCEKVTKDGMPVNPSGYFIISKKGGFFNVLVKHKNPIASSEVTFDIYLMIDNKETFINSVKMKVDPESTWFYKEITFYKQGIYKVYVYNEKDRFLGVGKMQTTVR